MAWCAVALFIGFARQDGLARLAFGAALLWLLYICAAVIATFILWRVWLEHAVGLRAATAWVASPPYLLRQPLTAVTFGIAMLGAIADADQGAPCPVSEHLLHHLEQLGTVADVPLPADTGVSRMESRWLSKWGVRIVVPLVGAERLEGILMLGEKRSEEPYSPGENAWPRWTRARHEVVEMRSKRPRDGEVPKLRPVAGREKP